MYAIIEDGGRQYKVSPNDIVELDRKKGEVGTQIEFKVLFYKDDNNIEIGTPYVENVKVQGVIERHGKGEKITVFKFKRRKNYKKKIGHRQQYTYVKIKDIVKN